MSNSARNHYKDPNALQLKALYDYVPESTFEGNYLSFKTGDVITVTEKCEGGWYKGVLNNNPVEGLFPPTYCEELPPRRVLNVDTKKTSPSIKRMQTLLQLTVTGTGEEVKEVEQEVDTDETRFTRERSQSDARVFPPNTKNSTAKFSFAKPGMREVATKVVEARRLLEGKLAGIVEDDGVREGGHAADPVREHEEPLVIDKPTESPDLLELKRRIRELESDKVLMMVEFTSGRERLQEEFSQRIALLNDMLDEKSLIIEIMKKDLEIKAEENKEITIELEMEMERLLQTCADLEEQVAHLTPLEEEGGEARSARDSRDPPAIPNHRNPPSSATPNSPPPHPLPLSPSTASSPLKRSASVPLAQELSAPPPETSPPSPPSPTSTEPPTTPVAPKPSSAKPPFSVPPISVPSDNQPSTPSASATTPTRPFPRLRSFPNLSIIPRDSSTSPRTRISRMPSSPRLLYSPTLLDSPGFHRADPRSRIPNFDSSLAKLAGLGAHPPSVPSDYPSYSDPALAAIEISELKKRIAELEDDRLRMIEEYRSRKASITSDPATTTTTSTTSSEIITSTSSLSNSASVPRTTTPPPLPPIPTLSLHNINKSENLPPVPLPPTSIHSVPSTSIPPYASPAPLSTSAGSLSSSQLAPKPTQDVPASSPSQARSTRQRKKDRKGPSPSSSSNPTATPPDSNSQSPKKEKPQNLTWLQGSVCVAVGSVAFYVVQSLVHRYYA